MGNLWEFPKNTREFPPGNMIPSSPGGEGGEPRKRSNGELPIYFLEILCGEKIIWNWMHPIPIVFLDEDNDVKVRYEEEDDDDSSQDTTEKGDDAK